MTAAFIGAPAFAEEAKAPSAVVEKVLRHTILNEQPLTLPLCSIIRFR